MVIDLKRLPLLSLERKVGGNGHNGGTGHHEDDGPVEDLAVVGALRANRLLRNLGNEGLSQLLGAGWRVMFKRDQVISRQAQPVDAVIFIVEGWAKAEVCSPTHTACKAVINILGPGDDVGLLSLVNDAPHSATVTAMDAIKALHIPMDTMRRYLHGHGEWYRVLAEIATERLHTNGVWLQALL